MKNSKSKIYKSLFVILAISLTVGCTPTDDDTNTTTTVVDNNPSQQQEQQDGTSNNNGSANDNSTNNGGEIASFDVNNIDLSRCTIWDGEYISSDKTVVEGCYKVTGTITVYGGATLTINPGSILIFDSDSYLYVGGTLKAVGTSEKPIVFTGLEKTPGYWRGIWMSNSTNSENELSNVLVEYAGDNSNCGNVDISGSRVKITDSTFRYSGNDGFCVDGYSNVSDFQRVTSVYNTDSAGEIHPSILGAIDSESNFTENTKNYLTMTGGNIDRDATWKELSVPVFVDDTVQIEDGTTLTINAGASFVFNSGTKFNVYGTLKAIGSGMSDATMSTQEQLENNITENPILFTGAEQIPGYWDGIEFYYSDSVENELSHVIVEYGGSDNNYANVKVANSSRLKVSDCTFRYSENDGFYVDGYSDIDRFDRVTSTLNSKSAGKVHPKILNIINSSNDFSGNTKDYLTVMSGTVENNAIWYPLNVPTMFIGNVDIDSGATLTIQAGTNMKFDSSALEINGVIKAIGTVNNPITFTGSQNVAGQWRGIYFYLSDSTENEIAYCDISYGGSQRSEGNIYVGQASRANIHDNVITNSGAYGVSVFSSLPNPINSDVESSNTFSNNARGNVNIE